MAGASRGREGPLWLRQGRNRAAKFRDSWKKPGTRIVLSSLQTPVALVGTGCSLAVIPWETIPQPTLANILPAAALFPFYSFLWAFLLRLHRLPCTGASVPPQCSPQFFGVPPGAVQAPPGKQPALSRNGTAPGKNAPCHCGVLKKRDYFYSNFPAILGKKENVKGNLFSLLFFRVFRVAVLLTQTKGREI